MASEDSISGNSRSRADGRGDTQMPAQRKGSGCHAEGEAVFDGAPRQYVLKAHPFQNQPAQARSTQRRRYARPMRIFQSCIVNFQHTASRRTSNSTLIRRAPDRRFRRDMKCTNDRRAQG